MSSITAGTTSTTTLVHSGDTTGSLVFKTNDTGSGGTTAVTIDTSQRAAFVAGTAALPAITTAGDTNTGIYFPAADTIAFAEGGAEAMRIDSSGNVGIGSSTITSADGAAGRIFKVSGATNTVWVGETTGNGGYNAFIFEARNSNRTNPRFAQIQMQTVSTATDGGLIAFSTSATGTGTDISERMRIDSSGIVMVGTTTTTPAGSGDTKGISLWTNGSSSQIFSTGNGDTAAVFNRAGSDGALIRTRRQGSDVGSISVTASATAYNTSSDYRLKEDIAPMTGALAKVALLKPVTYKWKVDGSDGEGFIAHELAEVKPDCVSGEKDAVDAEGKPIYQGIDTSFLVATLTAAIQELKATNDTQAETINAQSEAIASLTARVVALEGQ